MVMKSKKKKAQANGITFGMVMVEAMSSGTPVIAFNNGSVSEVMPEGH